MDKRKKPRTTIKEDEFTFTEPKLPEDLVFAEILSKLPAKSLMRFKCVSKSWLTRISSDSSFIAAHLNQQRLSLLSDSTTDIDIWNVMKRVTLVVGSCNGLVCLKVYVPGELMNRLMLWNPATRQYSYVDQEAIEKHSLEASNPYMPVSFGFGFDEESKDYKIVKILASWPTSMAHRLSAGKLSLSAQVFSKHNGDWRGLGEELSRLLTRIRTGPAAMANGALHWVGYKRGCGTEKAHCILSFNLRDELFQVTDPPDKSRCDDLALYRWKSSLAALVSNTGECCLWMVTAGDNNNNNNNRGDMKRCFYWSKMFKVSPSVSNFGFVRGVWKDQFVVERLDSGHRYMKLSLQDPVTGQVKELKRPETCWLFYYAFDYVESLVSVVF